MGIVLEKIGAAFRGLGGLFKGAGYPAIGDSIAPTRSLGTYYDSLYRGGGYAGDGSKYQYGLSSTGSSPILDHPMIRQNARSAVHESTAARGIIERYSQTVVDTGCTLECTPDAEILGITPEQARKWSSDVARRFDLWARSKKTTVAENMSFYQAQRFCMRARIRDGEYFARLFYSPKRDLLNPLQIGFVDPNQVRGYGLTDTWWPNVDKFIDGIDRDEHGRETAYKIWVLDGQGQYKPVTIPAVGRRSRRPLMLHAYAPEYAGQGRGFSPLAHAIQEFENLTDFTVAQIKKAIAQSSLTMYVKPSDENPASSPFVDHISGPVSQFDMPETPSPGGGVDTNFSSEDVIQYNRMNDAVLRPGSVGVFNLREGEDLKAFDGATPSENYSSFVSAFVGELAQSVGMPPEVLMLKFGQNYSASRAVLIMFWRAACIMRDEEASDFYNPVYQSWLSGEIAAGRISAPGWSDPRLRAAWASCIWNGPPMPSIDPSKTAKADQIYLEMGAKTLDQVAKETNGSDGTTNRAANAKQIEELTPVPWGKTGGSSGGETAGEAAGEAAGSEDDEDDGDEAENPVGRPPGT